MKMKLTDLIRKRGGLTRIFLDTPKYNGYPNIKPYITKMQGHWRVTPVPQHHNYDSAIMRAYRLA